MRKNAQIVTLSIVAAASIIFGMVLGRGPDGTVHTSPRSEAAPAAGERSPGGCGQCPDPLTILLSPTSPRR